MTRFIFHSRTFFKLYSSSKPNTEMYFSMFLFALAMAYVTLALSTSFLSFLSCFYDFAASKYAW